VTKIYFADVALFRGPGDRRNIDSLHYCHGSDYLLATVACNSDIPGFPQCLDVNRVSYAMWKGSRTEEYLEMAAVKEGNHMHVVDEINYSIAQLDSHCQCPFENCHRMIPNCHQGIVLS